MIKKFFREFFDEFGLILRAIPKGLKACGVAIGKGIPKFFKNLAPNIKKFFAGVVGFLITPFGKKPTGAKMFKAKMLLRGLLIFCLVTMGFGTAIYVVSNIVVENNMATISVVGSGDSDEETVQISLSETADFANPTVSLNCKGIGDLTNISGSALPSNIDRVEGSHNGEHYLAYTFYLRNTGDTACSLHEEMNIKSSIKNVDEAIRVRLYRNGEEITYAKLASDGMPEVGTIPFTGKNVFSQTGAEIDPGNTIRYTLVIWLEGDDPECLDNLKGGAVSMSMTFSIDRQESG